MNVFKSNLVTNSYLIDNYDMFINYDNDKTMSAFHIVSKKSHLGIRKEHDKNITSTVKITNA